MQLAPAGLGRAGRLDPSPADVNPEAEVADPREPLDCLYSCRISFRASSVVADVSEVESRRHLSPIFSWSASEPVRTARPYRALRSCATDTSFGRISCTAAAFHFERYQLSPTSQKLSLGYIFRRFLHRLCGVTSCIPTMQVAYGVGHWPIKQARHRVQLNCGVRYKKLEFWVQVDRVVVASVFTVEDGGPPQPTSRRPVPPSQHCFRAGWARAPTDSAETSAVSRTTQRDRDREVSDADEFEPRVDWCVRRQHARSSRLPTKPTPSPF